MTTAQPVISLGSDSASIDELLKLNEAVLEDVYPTRASKAEKVDAPVINEFPLCLECEFIEYQDGKYGCGVIGRVVNVTADESVMVDGKLDMSLVNAIAFDPYTHGYYKVTERVGEAFKDGLKLKK